MMETIAGLVEKELRNKSDNYKTYQKKKREKR